MTLRKIIIVLMTCFFWISADAAQFKGTILFENGSGVNFKEWTQNKDFTDCAKQYGRLFLYNRLVPRKPLTAKDVNTYLMAQLKQRKINPPYILVAHSYGAMYSMYFARKYPDLVKGVLLVDPVPPDFVWQDSIKKEKKKNPELHYQLLGFEKTKKEISDLPPLSDTIPIIIVSSSDMEKNAPIKGDWVKQQEQWLNKNPDSKLVKVEGGHFIQMEHPDVVCEQIKELTNVKS